MRASGRRSPDPTPRRYPVGLGDGISTFSSSAWSSLARGSFRVGPSPFSSLFSVPSSGGPSTFARTARGEAGGETWSSSAASPH